MVTCAPSTIAAVSASAAPAQLDLFVCPFVVIQDTREQAPWTFQGIILDKRQWVVPRKVATVATGDYSIEGRQTSLVIERKSSSDLIGSVTAGNARFRREHERMAEIVKAGGFACVVVEGCLAAICDELDHDHDAGRRVTSESILGAVASWPARYHVPWFFAGDRRRAEQLAFRVLIKQWKEQAHG